MLVAQGCLSQSDIASSAARSARPSQGAPPAPSVHAADPKRLDVTPEQIVKDFRANSVRAHDFYRGKTLRVTGRVSQVSNDMFGSDKAAVVIKVDDGTWLPPSIEIWYGPSFRDRIGRLTDGQTVTCEGEFEDTRYDGSVVLGGLAIK